MIKTPNRTNWLSLAISAYSLRINLDVFMFLLECVCSVCSSTCMYLCFYLGACAECTYSPWFRGFLGFLLCRIPLTNCLLFLSTLAKVIKTYQIRNFFQFLNSNEYKAHTRILNQEITVDITVSEFQWRWDTQKTC